MFILAHAASPSDLSSPQCCPFHSGTRRPPILSFFSESQISGLEGTSVGITWPRGQQTLTVTGQTVHMLGFAGHTVSVTTA